MKSLIYKVSAYLLATLLGASFYFTIFKIFKSNPVIGLAIVSSIILISAFLILEKDEVVIEEA